MVVVLLLLLLLLRLLKLINHNVKVAAKFLNKLIGYSIEPNGSHAKLALDSYAYHNLIEPTMCETEQSVPQLDYP